MPTVQAIDNFALRVYPKASNILIADRISDLDDIHKEIFVKIGRLSNQFENIIIGLTVANETDYLLPTDCTIDNIVAIKVSKTTVLTDEWNEFIYTPINSNISHGCYFSKSRAGYFALAIDGKPIITSGLTIVMYYYKNPTTLASSALTVTPDLYEMYHNLLKYRYIQRLASQGENPDSEIANYWEKEYQEYFDWVKSDISERNNSTPDQANQVRGEW